jgi:hypothetical protein
LTRLKSSIKPDEAALLDVAHATRLVRQFKAGLDKLAFLHDVKAQRKMAAWDEQYLLKVLAG